MFLKKIIANNITVHRYSAADRDAWDDFIKASKNGTFLLCRNYMDYHKDLFKDHSMMLYDKGKLVAVLPANLKNEKTLISHEGLTYGGFIVLPSASTVKIIDYVRSLLEALYNQGIEKLYLKHLPDFFAKCSQQELEYIYFLLNATNYRTDMAFVIDYKNAHPLKMTTLRKRGIKKGMKEGVEILNNDNLAEFWNDVLTPNLQERFGVKPVHTLEEICLLKEKNKPFIQQFSAFYNGQIVAGAIMFETETTAHLQYLASNDEGRRVGALDLLMGKVIEHYASTKAYFDFGIVNEEEGRKINYGMIAWKRGFGSRAFVHRFYKVETKKFVNIKQENLAK